MTVMEFLLILCLWTE